MLRLVTDLFTPGDGGRHAAYRLFAYSFLTSSSYMIARSLADGLFLGYLGPEVLPLAMLFAALVVTPATLAWTRLSGGSAIVRVIMLTRLLLASGTAALAWMLPGSDGSFLLLSLLYLVAELRACLNTIQFTTLLNETLSHTNRHLAAFVSAGAPLAGIVTGTVIGLELGEISYSQMLWAAVVLDSVATLPLLARSVNRVSARGLAEPRNMPGGADTAAENSLVRALMVMIAVKVAVLTIVGYEWKVAAATFFGGRKDDLARYFAVFYAICDAVTLAIQLLVSGHVIRRFGVSLGLAVLPIVLGISLFGGVLSDASTAVLIWMTCAKATDILRRGLHEPALMLTYRPIGVIRRRRVIGLVNGMLKPLMEAGVVLGVFVIAFLADRTASLFVVAVLLIPVWCVTCWRVLGAYRDLRIHPNRHRG